jgi:hypothetical protein
LYFNGFSSSPFYSQRQTCKTGAGNTHNGQKCSAADSFMLIWQPIPLHSLIPFAKIIKKPLFPDNALFRHCLQQTLEA